MENEIKNNIRVIDAITSAIHPSHANRSENDIEAEPNMPSDFGDYAIFLKNRIQKQVESIIMCVNTLAEELEKNAEIVGNKNTRDKIRLIRDECLNTYGSIKFDLDILQAEIKPSTDSVIL